MHHFQSTTCNKFSSLMTITLSCLLPEMNIGSYVFLPRGPLRRWLTHSYKQMFKENPLSKAKSPLDSNDHPKLVQWNSLVKEVSRCINHLLVQCSWPSVLTILTLLYMSYDHVKFQAG
jgi:hypothetical protein